LGLGAPAEGGVQLTQRDFSWFGIFAVGVA
jgi:hypothetical protein